MICGPGHCILYCGIHVVLTFIQSEVYQLSGQDHGRKPGKAGSVNDPVYSRHGRDRHGDDGLYFICVRSSRPRQSGTSHGVYLDVYGRIVRVDDLVYDPGKKIE